MSGRCLTGLIGPRHIPQDWIEEWKQGVFDYNAEGVAWIRSRPKDVQDLLIRFPPSCLVRATRPLDRPFPGTIGIVTSYFEGGLVGVINYPLDDVRAQCQVDWLEVVGYWRGLTSDVVRDILDGQRR